MGDALGQGPGGKRAPVAAAAASAAPVSGAGVQARSASCGYEVSDCGRRRQPLPRERKDPVQGRLNAICGRRNPISPELTQQRGRETERAPWPALALRPAGRPAKEEAAGRAMRLRAAEGAPGAGQRAAGSAPLPPTLARARLRSAAAGGQLGGRGGEASPQVASTVSRLMVSGKGVGEGIRPSRPC